MTDRPFSVLEHPKDNPALVPSGYGKIARYITPRLLDAGYPVRLHCTVGHQQNVMEWVDPLSQTEFEIWPGGNGPYGEDIIPGHLGKIQEVTGKPGILFMIGDTEAMGTVPQWLESGEVMGLSWSAVDWLHPTPPTHRERLKRWPALFAMSEAGTRVLKQAGLGNVMDPVHLGVNPDIFHPRPRSDYPNIMQSCGWDPDGFNVITVAANQWLRKGWMEMLTAVGEFHRRHPEANIHLYCLTQTRREWDLPQLAQHLGVQDLVSWSNDYEWLRYGYPEDTVSLMFSCADATLSLGFEGFGFQNIESQACGTPVIGLNDGATPELVESGVLVPPKEPTVHNSLVAKTLPQTPKVVEALEHVYEHRGDPEYFPDVANDIHEKFNWDRIGAQVVERLETFEEMLWGHEWFAPVGPSPEAEELARNVVVIE